MRERFLSCLPPEPSGNYTLPETRPSVNTLDKLGTETLPASKSCPEVPPQSEATEGNYREAELLSESSTSFTYVISRRSSTVRASYALSRGAWNYYSFPPPQREVISHPGKRAAVLHQSSCRRPSFLSPGWWQCAAASTLQSQDYDSGRRRKENKHFYFRKEKIRTTYPNLSKVCT